MDFTDLSIYKDSKEYIRLVDKVESKYENDIERIQYAREIMPNSFYIQYTIYTLQGKLLRTPMSETISIKAGNLDDMLRCLLYINDYVSDKVPYEYVVKKSDRFIKELINQLY